MSSATSASAFGAGLENRVVDGFTSLSASSSSEEIATRYDIGLRLNRIGFLEHVKIGLRLSIADLNTLEDLVQQTDVYADLEPISKGHFSKLTTRRPARAVAELATAVLEHPFLYHPAGVVANGSNTSVTARSSAVMPHVSHSERHSSSVPKTVVSSSLLPPALIRP